MTAQQLEKLGLAVYELIQLSEEGDCAETEYGNEAAMILEDLGLNWPHLIERAEGDEVDLPGIESACYILRVRRRIRKARAKQK